MRCNRSRGFIQCDDITKGEKSHLEDDNVYQLEGGFMIEGIGKAWGTKLCKRREHRVGGAVRQGAGLVESGVLMSLHVGESKRQCLKSLIEDSIMRF